MHRSLEITALPKAVDGLVQDLLREEHVVGVARQRGASVQPPGWDVWSSTRSTGAPTR
jgi:hypothetical protein